MEYYNKILKYYNLDWTTMIKTMKPKQIIEFIDKTKHHLTDDNIKHIDKITKKIPNKFSYSFNESVKSKDENLF